MTKERSEVLLDCLLSMTRRPGTTITLERVVAFVKRAALGQTYDAISKDLYGTKNARERVRIATAKCMRTMRHPVREKRIMEVWS